MGWTLSSGMMHAPPKEEESVHFIAAVNHSLVIFMMNVFWFCPDTLAKN
jgi:hypothetical protein